VDFSLLFFTDGAKNANPDVYTALKTFGGTASLVGITDLDLDAWNFAVQLNQVTQRCSHELEPRSRLQRWCDGCGRRRTGNALGWTDARLRRGERQPVECRWFGVGRHCRCRDHQGELRARGRQVKSADLPSGDTEEADAIALKFTDVDVFIGVGGDLSDGVDLNDHSDDQIVNGSAGFRATVGGLTVVSIKDRGAMDAASDDTRYVGVALGRLRRQPDRPRRSADVHCVQRRCGGEPGEAGLDRRAQARLERV
jgi:hypothetical protein